MAVEVTTTSVTYDGNGNSATAYPVTFPFLDASHLVVKIKPSGGNWITIATSQWAVTGTSLRITSGAVPLSTKVCISRRTPVVQPLVYTPGGVFPAKAHEHGLDRAMMVHQERTSPYGSNPFSEVWFTSGAKLYTIGQELRFRSPNGTITTLAP